MARTVSPSSCRTASTTVSRSSARLGRATSDSTADLISGQLAGECVVRRRCSDQRSDSGSNLIELPEPRAHASIESLTEAAYLTRDGPQRAVETSHPTVNLRDRSTELGHVAFKTADSAGDLSEGLAASRSRRPRRQLVETLAERVKAGEQVVGRRLHRADHGKRPGVVRRAPGDGLSDGVETLAELGQPVGYLGDLAVQRLVRWLRRGRRSHVLRQPGQRRTDLAEHRLELALLGDLVLGRAREQRLHALGHRRVGLGRAAHRLVGHGTLLGALRPAGLLPMAVLQACVAEQYSPSPLRRCSGLAESAQERTFAVRRAVARAAG